jgi:uncharacterized membrane protein YgcG
MSQLEYGEHDMEFDNLHTVENFTDIYDNPAEMVVHESISNSLDAGASNVNIKTEANSGETSVSFLDDGPGMDTQQFADYQVGSRSAKNKKFGLGFAGIGSKLYAGKYHKTKIITETFDGKKQLACAFYVKEGKYKVCQRKPTYKFTKPGTFYKVILKPTDHYYLEHEFDAILVDTFNNAMLNGLNITVNGNKIKPYSPTATKKQTGMISHKGKKLRYHFYLLEKDWEYKNWRNINYQIMGKTICNKQLDFLNEVKAEYHKQIYVTIDALPLKFLLKTDKSSFSTWKFREYNKVVNKQIHAIVKKLNLLSNNTPNKLINNILTKAFAKLLSDPKYAWLNPHATTVGTGGGGGSGGGGSGGGGSGGSCGGTKGTRGFSMGLSDSPNDKRDGWLDIQNNQLVINVGHPLYIKFENYATTLEWHYARVAVSVLVLHGSMQKTMTMQEATELQTELLTEVKDELWL